MITYALIGFLLFEAIAIANLILAIQHAPDGWEDAQGFHPGQPPAGPGDSPVGPVVLSVKVTGRRLRQRVRRSATVTANPFGPY